MINQLCEYGCGQVANHQLKNGKHCCSRYSTQCPEVKAKNSISRKKGLSSGGKHAGWTAFNSTRVACKYCEQEVTLSSINKHESSCYLNPDNKIDCPVCGKPIKNYRKNVTCSHECANTHFRSNENNPNWKESSYKSTCFLYHERCCVICGEANVVEVHHFDENNQNNTPENLIPLCPTHHQYMHSRFRSMIDDDVNRYHENFQTRRKSVADGLLWEQSDGGSSPPA